MSQGDKKKDQKKNTDAWKLKQEEKKKKKEGEPASQPTKEGAQNQNKKSQGKKQKAKAKKEEQIKEPQQIPTVVELQVISEPAIIYKQLAKVDRKIKQQERCASRSYQWQLVFKYLEQYITKQDTIIFIGSREWVPSCPQVYVPHFNNCLNAQLVCRYPDLTYFLESSVTKMFIEADFIFANGSILAKKGTLNLVLLAEYYNIPVVGFGGSWSYNGWAPLSESALIDRYGEAVLSDLDWIQAKYFKNLTLQIGSINGKQVSTFPPIIYKDISFSSIEW